MGFRDLSLSYALGYMGYRSSNISSRDLGNASLDQVSYTTALQQKSKAPNKARHRKNTNCYGHVKINLVLNFSTESR